MASIGFSKKLRLAAFFRFVAETERAMAISLHFFYAVCLLLLDSTQTLSLSMSPRRVLVTGANTGIGLALTKQLVKDHGCHVYLGSRSVEKGEKAVDEVKREAGDSVELLNIVSYVWI